jgi:hypothetical protein
MRCDVVFFLCFLLCSVAAKPDAIVTAIPYFADPQSSVPIQGVAADPAGNIYIAGATAGAIPIRQCSAAQTRRRKLRRRCG